MQFSRSTVKRLFLLVWVLAACAPGVLPNTVQGVTLNTAQAVVPTTAPGNPPNSGQTVTPISVSGAATTDTPAAAHALERYLGALTSKNESVFSQSICKEWEPQAFLEFDAYQGLELVLKGLACSGSATKPGEALVTCQGKILLNYGNERQEVDLSRRNYRLTYRGDLWQVCGFTE